MRQMRRNWRHSAASVPLRAVLERNLKRSRTLRQHNSLTQLQAAANLPGRRSVEIAGEPLRTWRGDLTGRPDSAARTRRPAYGGAGDTRSFPYLAGVAEYPARWCSSQGCGE